ncbi:DUF3899 domain-containing protein [Bacillus thermotolerans]|uniref:DUF3899 domain-containing protein n=1 Tax=Bacillus thermotolerans TaxID=1221996 RepID=UPI0005891B34|nr:DUF3899 domain-containing protein [Bacillus thermotolerans]KKB43216.1 hypothetical protein QY96_00921 [Bacillus thermotolerans]
MAFIQKSLMVSGFIIVLALIFSFASSSFWRSLLDYSFLFSLLCATAGAFLFVLERGFFNGIIYSSKIFRKSTKEGEYASSFDDLDDTGAFHEEHTKLRAYKWTFPLLVSGGAFLILTTAAGFISLS